MTPGRPRTPFSLRGRLRRAGGACGARGARLRLRGACVGSICGDMYSSLLNAQPQYYVVHTCCSTVRCSACRPRAHTQAAMRLPLRDRACARADRCAIAIARAARVLCAPRICLQQAHTHRLEAMLWRGRPHCAHAQAHTIAGSCTSSGAMVRKQDGGPKRRAIASSASNVGELTSSVNSQNRSFLTFAARLTDWSAVWRICWFAR